MGTSTQAIEVLVSNKAYVVEKIGVINANKGEDTGDSQPIKSAQVTWSKRENPLRAWEIAKHRSNFVWDVLNTHDTS